MRTGLKKRETRVAVIRKVTMLLLRPLRMVMLLSQPIRGPVAICTRLMPAAVWRITNRISTARGSIRCQLPCIIWPAVLLGIKCSGRALIFTKAKTA